MSRGGLGGRLWTGPWDEIYWRVYRYVDKWGWVGLDGEGWGGRGVVQLYGGGWIVMIPAFVLGHCDREAA